MDKMEFGTILQAIMKDGTEGTNTFNATKAVKNALQIYDADTVFETIAICRENGDLRFLMSVKANAFLDAVLYIAQKKEKNIVKKMKINSLTGLLCKVKEEDFKPYAHVLGEAILIQKDQYSFEVELGERGEYTILGQK